MDPLPRPAFICAVMWRDTPIPAGAKGSPGTQILGSLVPLTFQLSFLAAAEELLGNVVMVQALLLQ